MVPFKFSYYLNAIQYEHIYKQNALQRFYYVIWKVFMSLFAYSMFSITRPTVIRIADHHIPCFYEFLCCILQKRERNIINCKKCQQCIFSLYTFTPLLNVKCSNKAFISRIFEGASRCYGQAINFCYLQSKALLLFTLPIIWFLFSYFFFFFCWEVWTAHREIFCLKKQKEKKNVALPLIYDDKQSCLLDAVFCLLWISPPRCG